MTFKRVLIANRGEIALRVVRACRDAGLTSIAVYADPDAGRPYAQLADEAVALGGSTAADSYLDIGRLLAAAGQTAADAVHPGYGFLAENADFAQAVMDAGLTWIGPPPSVIRALGDKVQARAIARQAGAPLVPGTTAPVADAAQAVSSRSSTGSRSRSRPRTVAAAAGCGSSATWTRWCRCSMPRYARPRPRSAGVSASSRPTSNGAGTSKPRCSRTPRARWWSSAPATARCSAGTRSWSRRRPRRS